MGQQIATYKGRVHGEKKGNVNNIWYFLCVQGKSSISFTVSLGSLLSVVLLGETVSLGSLIYLDSLVPLVGVILFGTFPTPRHFCCFRHANKEDFNSL